MDAQRVALAARLAAQAALRLALYVDEAAEGRRDQRLIDASREELQLALRTLADA